jgi:AraC-like DNA-binding protein
MIVAPLSDPALRATVRRAALPEEDVFCCPREVRRALLRGYPRLFVAGPGPVPGFLEDTRARMPDLPSLALGPADLPTLRTAGEHDGLAISQIEDSVHRLRGLIRTTAVTSVWVEGIFADLARIVGHAPPPEFRGFARRVLEYPIRYPSLTEIASVEGLSAGALKGRFRRRDLPGPGRYLRWLRLLAAGRVLSDPEVTTLVASYRLGFSSDGNFCRWVQMVAGMPPSALRGETGRLTLLAKFAGMVVEDRAFERWGSLEGLFLREVA